MKKLSKILCAVLVLAILCSSLILVIGAEENSGYTSAPATAEEIAAAIKYDAEDNLLARLDMATNTAGGWNGTGAPQAHIVTNTETGATHLHHFVDSAFVLKEDATDGNEFINFVFNSVNLKYEEGYREYIIVEYELSHKTVDGTFNIPDGSSKKSQPMKQEVIVRGSSAGTSWATTQVFKDFGLGDKTGHVATIYDYTTGNAYTFVNGVLTKTYANGALSAGVLPTYLAGESLTTQEWRVGSNSFDEYTLDNAYIRYTKVSAAEDTVPAAVKSGVITDWSGNVYTGPIAAFAESETGDYDFVDFASKREDNELSVSSIAQRNDDYVRYIVSLPSGDKYIRVDTLTNGQPAGHVQWNNYASDDIVYDAANPAYAVYEMDIATESYLTQFAMVTNIRTEADGKGSDVGSPVGNVYFADLTLAKNGFSHLTVIYDFNNNKLLFYVNNSLVKEVKLLKDETVASWKKGEVTLHAGLKIQSHASYGRTPTVKGETFILDNLFVKVMTGSEAGNIADGISAKDLNKWTDAMYGEDYEFTKLPAVAIVDGIEMYSSQAIEAYLTDKGNEKISIKFLREPKMPTYINGNVIIDTNGLDINKLAKFSSACSAPEIDGNIYTVVVPWINNYTSVHTPVGSNQTSNSNAVKYNHPSNIFSKLSGVNYDGASQRWEYIVTNLDTGDVFINDKPGEKGAVGGGSNTYLEVKPSGNINYEYGQNQVIIYDLDVAIYNREVGAFNFISRFNGGDGAWGNFSPSTDHLLSDVELGEFVHLTLMVFTDSRNGYYFVNNELVWSAENALTEGAAYFQDLRLFGNSLVDISFDNICIRNLKRAELENIAKTGDLSAWDEAIYSDEYVLPTSPAVATVDGVGYGSVEALNKALAVDTEEPKVVDFKHPPVQTVEIRSSATVDTHGLDIKLDWNTGLYEFDPENFLYESSETGLAYATSKLIHTTQGTVHTFTTIDATNCRQNATPVTWYYDEELSTYDVVFYVFGETIAPIEYDAFIEEGIFYHDEWKEIILTEDSYEITEIVEEFPVASKDLEEKSYVYELVTKEVDFIADDIKIGATVNSNIQFTVYVNKYQTISEGEPAVIGGVEYVAFNYNLAPHEIEKIVKAEFIVVDEEGNEYVQRQSLSFIDYARDILSGDHTDADKKVVANLLAYANEAYALFEDGAKMESVTELLETYSSYVTSDELTEKLDTTDLKSVIRSAALRLNAAPEFVFRVARGFKGTITFTYTGIHGEKKVNKTVDATAQEVFVTLDGIDVSDLYVDITITATKDGETEPSVSGTYNLATYAQGLENNAFAVALYNYSKAAYSHKKDLVFVSVITGYETRVEKDDKGNEITIIEPIIEVYGEYTPGSKIEIPFIHDGLTITWYLGEGEGRTEIDINNFVITEDVLLTYTEIINKTTLDIVTSDTLKLINESKIKQFDGCDVSVSDEDKGKYGYFDKEGGVANYVTAIKDGQPIEALYFSRTVEWSTTATDGNAQWAEHRYTLDGSRKLASFTFDYLILGTVGRHQAASGESYGESIFQIKYTDASTAKLGLSDSYKNIDYGNAVFLEDGQWHTFTYEAFDPIELDSVLIKLYQFLGEMLIANIEIEYAPLDIYNSDGTLNVNTILKENVSNAGYTLTTIVDSKIKQLDQTAPATGGDYSHGYFVKEGGTPVFVNAVKDGELVEALYFSRSKDKSWSTYKDADQNSGFSEFRFDTKGAYITGFSFDYLVKGTTEEREEYGADFDGTAVYLGHSYVQVKSNGTYYDMPESALITDGEWHTMTIEFSEAKSLDNILVKLQKFIGEMVISNLVIEYVE